MCTPADTMFDDPGLAFEAVSEVIKARGLRVADLESIWSETESEVDGFTGFKDQLQRGSE